MSVIIPMLKLILIGLALSQSYEPTVRDLECFNDYDKEMVCQIKYKTSCCEYELKIQNKICNFTQCNFSCECKLHIPTGFVLKQDFKAVLWRGGKHLFNKDINIEQSIKPKRPTIVSVKQTKHGNFLITWNTHYTDPLYTVFIESLTMELNYRDKRGIHNEPILLEKGRTEYELVGRNLQPNSEYVVTARVSSDYNNNSRFSDYSEPYEFSTPSSLQNILIIIIPISCAILVLFISTAFCCYLRLKRELWDKLPTPKIASSFKTQIPILPPFENEFSPIYLENSTLDQIENKPWISSSSSQADVSNERHHRQSLGTGSSPVQHSQIHPGSERQNEVTVNALVNNLQTSMVYNTLEHLKSSQPTAASSSGTEKVSRKSGSSTGLLSCSNNTYFCSASNGSSLWTQSEDSFHTSTNLAPPQVSNKMTTNLNTTNLTTMNTDFQQESGNTPGSFFSVHFLGQITPLASRKSENSFPAITTDFEYGPCVGCSEPADASQAQSTHSSSETVVVPGYQSTDELLDHENKPEADASVKQALISRHDDANSIVAKPVCFKNPEDASFLASESGVIIPVDEVYQSFPGLEKCTELKPSTFEAVTQKEHHNLGCSGQQVHAKSFESLCGPSLHISPGIQIDCSYKRM
ncbi:uncharacterized protein [Salminus brasiliensis]|uniref:uncharacterized protein isoform X2 n=1 Tax=Salminus brasiliensis TaxID=930266 RepID=UPI003B839A0C